MSCMMGSIRRSSDSWLSWSSPAGLLLLLLYCMTAAASAAAKAVESTDMAREAARTRLMAPSSRPTSSC